MALNLRPADRFGGLEYTRTEHSGAEHVRHAAETSAAFKPAQRAPTATQRRFSRTLGSTELPDSPRAALMTRC